MVSALASISFMSASTRAAKSDGSSPARGGGIRAASAGYSFSYPANSRFQRRSALAPRLRASQPSYTCFGISNGGCRQPIASRVAATSFSPSGAPCAAPVLALVGAPFAITVLAQISVGRVFSRFALRSARSTAVTS